jgi:hypothetical protein
MIYGIAMIVLAAINESADALNILPPQVFPWVRLTLTIMGGVGGLLWAQSKVTPLSDPRDDLLRPLVVDPRGERPRS